VARAAVSRRGQLRDAEAALLFRTRPVELVGELVRVGAQVVVLAEEDLAAVHPAGQPAPPVQAEAVVLRVLLGLADVRRPTVDRLLVLAVPPPLGSTWSRSRVPSSEWPSCGVSGVMPAASRRVGAMSTWAVSRSSLRDRSMKSRAWFLMTVVL
jgi:hypothetical protein